MGRRKHSLTNAILTLLLCMSAHPHAL